MPRFFMPMRLADARQCPFCSLLAASFAARCAPFVVCRRRSIYACF